MGRRMLFIVFVAAVSATTGCLFSGNSKTIQPTAGQELTDLKTARDKGVITEEEYNEKRVAILHGSGKKKETGEGPQAATASWKNMGTKNR